MTRTRSAQRGFTLGETLMSLAVAAIALAMAVPGLDALTRGNREAASVNQLVSTMHLARSEAVTRNELVTVCASRDGQTCAGEWQEGWITFLDADADLARDDDEQLLDQVAALDGITLESAQFAHAFSYGANGRVAGDVPASGTGEFSFCPAGAGQADRVVIVRASGLPALSDKGRDGEPVDCQES